MTLLETKMTNTVVYFQERQGSKFEGENKRNILFEFYLKIDYINTFSAAGTRCIAERRQKRERDGKN